VNTWEKVAATRIGCGEGDWVGVNPREVRAYVREVLASEAVDLDDIELMTSEIATNAGRHSRSGTAGGGLWVTVLRSPDRVRVEFQDDGGGNSAPDIPKSAAETGRGLQIVDALSSSWGWSVGADGARRITVWFEVER
jgi:anti-sigma regulatory factor (Ser/Thr protein kinase)